MKLDYTKKVEQIFEELKGIGLTTGQFPEYVEWDEYVAGLGSQASPEADKSEDKSLQKILNLQRCPEKLKGMKLNDILHKNFYEAKKYIDLMPLDMRIDMLAELEEYKTYLYDSVGEWGNDSELGKTLSAKDVRSLLGKIKHLEIIQNWLFGIE